MSAQYVPGNRVPCSPEVRSFTDYKTGWLGAAASGILQGKILKSLVSSSLCKHPTGKREVNCFFFFGVERGYEKEGVLENSRTLLVCQMKRRSF